MEHSDPKYNRSITKLKGSEMVALEMDWSGRSYQFPDMSGRDSSASQKTAKTRILG